MIVYHSKLQIIVIISISENVSLSDQNHFSPSG